MERTILPPPGPCLLSAPRSATSHISRFCLFPLFCQDVIETSGATRVPHHRFAHKSPAFYPSLTPNVASNTTRLLSESGIIRAGFNLLQILHYWCFLAPNQYLSPKLNSRYMVHNQATPTSDSLTMRLSSIIRERCPLFIYRREGLAIPVLSSRASVQLPSAEHTS